jgi:uncharacterized protein (DUF952 family)
VILHLVPAAVWAQVAGHETYAPESLESEGFVHCTGDDDLMLTVANAFYRSVGDVLVLSLDESRLAADVRWEPPAPLPDGWAGAPMFPHVFGPLDLAAVVDVRQLVRDDAGSFVAYARA